MEFTDWHIIPTTAGFSGARFFVLSNEYGGDLFSGHTVISRPHTPTGGHLYRVLARGYIVCLRIPVSQVPDK
jgi:hypothetical protein